MRFRLFPLIFVCLFIAGPVCGQIVDEAGSTAVINGANAEIVLAADGIAKGGDVRAELELVDTKDIVRARTSQLLKLQSGKRQYPLTLPLRNLVKDEGDDLGWFRLRYRLGDSTGIMALSEMMKDVFELRVAATDRVVPGSDYRVRVRAVNPFTKAGVRRVAIDGKLELDLVSDSTDDEITLTATDITGSDGLTVLHFKVPPGIQLDYEPEMKIVGRKNGVVRELEEDIESNYRQTPVFFTTDKPMYQPGETFNLRGLFLDPNNTVVAGKEVELSIEDEDNTQLFRQTVTTSAYGIASISWKIPADAKLGTYDVELDSDEYFNFKVTRYDLPKFVVAAEADKGFYLTTDRMANITVSADYLFGKPVTRGKVRVVRETERKWNYDEQKYDVDEDAGVVEGVTNADGKYIAKIDLADEIAELERSDWMRFQDLHFAAYFTDESTNRTEEKRIDIRLTKEPIHVYLIHYADQNPNLPMLAYVSTFYADGSPATCDVTASSRNEELDSFTTNSLGAGEMRFRIPDEALNDRKFSLKIAARDKRGKRGTFHEYLELNKDDAIQIETDKAVYKAGDVIKVEVASTVKQGLVYVDLLKDNVVLESRHVNLRNGKAGLLFPYSRTFKGALTIAAYSDTEKSYWEEPKMRFARGVIFPEREDFRLNANFGRRTYKPGEDGSIRFSVTSTAGLSVERALGITIFDKAIEERSRTDGTFRDYFGGFASLMGLDRGFGNISLRDLNNIDVGKPVSEEMQLAAEVILAASQHRASVYQTRFDAQDAHTVYSAYFDKQAKGLEKVLAQRFEKDYAYPSDAESLAAIVNASGRNYADYRDPWGMPYVPAFGVERSQLVLTLSSSGPDKRPDTPDDFVILTSRFSYFAKIANAIDGAVSSEYLATGRHVRDIATLKDVMKSRGVDPALLVDPWKRPYAVSFGVAGRNYVIEISSLGPDGVASTARWGSDDFRVSRVYTDYFFNTESEISKILYGSIDSGNTNFPTSVPEFKKVLRDGGVDVDLLRDGNGRPVLVTATAKRELIWKPVIENGATVMRSVPVEGLVFSIRSAGTDRVNESNDVELASFSRATINQYQTGGSASMTMFDSTGAKGAIQGTITDANGAVIPNIEVVAFEAGDETRKFITTTDAEGRFLLANLPSGKYSVTAVGSSGFTNYRQENVAVRSQKVVQLDITLSVATVEASVDVSSPVAVDQTTNSTGTNITRSSSAGKIVFPYPDQSSTPRLREYFPETLLWQPELITDRRGRAELNFKVADNITTWKMYAIASTKDGKVGVAEKAFAAFQPFFVDLDPPKFLTEGDRISLPVQVRNYTEAKQSVDVSMAKADWFSMAGADRHTIDVDAGASKNAIFAFRADAAIRDGKQRVTAIAKKDSDAIEKPVTVRPNGQEVVRTDSKLFNGTQTFNLDYPTNALSGTPTAVVKVYPNLFSHVTESVEGLLKRPYGCGEQTTSSTYPNVMILKFLKGDTPLRRKAQEYLKQGYERLIGYQVADGGFSYWGGKDSSNIALTAYVLRFLHDAKEFTEVDAEVIRRAEDYLARVQVADGSWPGRHSTESARISMTTAYVARSIAMRKSTDKNGALQKAFAYLDTQRAAITDSYTLALFGLALHDAGDVTKARTIAEQLQKAAVVENGSAYWDLDSSTLFYGWGTTGRIETTALVVQLLTRTIGVGVAREGALYLLRNKDRYGVWYSTQTTVNVLDAFLATLAVKSDANAQSIEVLLNGASLQTIAADTASVVPTTIDLAGKLNPTSNILEVRGIGESPVMVQAVMTHYIAWADVPADTKSPVLLNYKCDKADAAIMDEINCAVESGRRSQGYAMLLAEIGLPPGADVRRESLDRAVQEYAISRYDILPDRIVVYFWSSGPGTKFNFSFRPRYGIDAQTPPSVVYDYYNPEAQAIAAPIRFSIR